MRYICLSALLVLTIVLKSQNVIKGTVYDDSSCQDEHHKHVLPNANVYLSDKSLGTTTDSEGNFSLELKSVDSKLFLIASYMGFKNDSLKIEKGKTMYNFSLKEGNEISEVEVAERTKGEYISKINTIQTQVISTAGLQKLACCNLSESFENSATVDVSYSDAVSGAKQIQMLGLAGIYSQILTENVPAIRGLSAPFGLGYIPGNWMESIQISKGTSAVINGYESITGQINIEYKKPENSEPFFI
jgi:outer membrane receptor for ferrienterochelin and colicins